MTLKTPAPLLSRVHENMKHVNETLGNSSDIVIKEMHLGRNSGMKIGIIYIEGLAEVSTLLQSLLPDESRALQIQISSPPAVLNYLKQVLIPIGDIREIQDFDSLFLSVLSGDTVLLLEDNPIALSVGTRGGEKRAVEEPNTQSVIRGPREGFTETLRTNTALVRRKIKDVRFRMESKMIGQVTKTDVEIVYIQGIADEKVVNEVRSRLNQIDIDGILESGYIEEFIQEENFTPFPTVYNTERPDTVAAALLEGRVAIFVEGTPFVLLVPALFIQFFQASEDYYQRADFGSFIRILRLISFFIALLAPSLYIAITTFAEELIPTPLLISLAGQREGVPFPAFIEAMLMEVMFEILREAGVRMPKTIGQSVSIVGTLVIGQAAVEAGLVSPAMVIIVSITAISNFVIPAFNMGISIRILRFFFMGLAASFGLFGVVIGTIGLVLHLCSLKSFGVPYLSPFSPLKPDAQKDVLFRFPVWALNSRHKKKDDRK